MEKVLITGITGQDGIFLTKALLESTSNISIVGTSRSIENKNFFMNLNRIYSGSNQNLKILKLNFNESNKVFGFLEDYKPTQIYNLMGPSSVYESFLNNSNKNTIVSNFDNLVGSLIKQKNFCNFFQASSSEMFDVSKYKLNEESSMKPRSPYAEAKYKNHLSVKQLNEEYSWNIKSGIMFNHESEYRSNQYLFMKIINAAANIKSRNITKFSLGSLKYIRDWSFAGDFAEALISICQDKKENSYVIGSGKGTSIKEIVEIVFDYYKLNWENHLEIDSSILRKGDPEVIISDPNLIKNNIGWESTTSIENLTQRCIKK